MYEQSYHVDYVELLLYTGIFCLSLTSIVLLICILKPRWCARSKHPIEDLSQFDSTNQKKLAHKSVTSTKTLPVYVIVPSLTSSIVTLAPPRSLSPKLFSDSGLTTSPEIKLPKFSNNKNNNSPVKR